MSNTGRMNNLRAMPGLLAAKRHCRSEIRGQLTESEDGGKGQSADSGWVALAIKFGAGRANLFRRFARRRADRRAPRTQFPSPLYPIEPTSPNSVVVCVSHPVVKWSTDSRRSL